MEHRLNYKILSALRLVQEQRLSSNKKTDKRIYNSLFGNVFEHVVGENYYSAANGSPSYLNNIP